MLILLKIVLDMLIVGLFLYSKLLPYKDRLAGQYKGVFDFFDKLFTPLLNGLRSIVKPAQVGIGLSVDMTQIVLLVLLLVINNVIR